MSRQEAERLVETYSDLVLRLSYTYLKSREDAKDICQTVFLKLLEKPRVFDSPEHEKAWIIRTAANACKDVLKSHWRRTRADLQEADGMACPQAEEGSLLAAVELLPPKYRAVIYLYYYEGYAADERRSHRCWESTRPPYRPSSAVDAPGCAHCWNRRDWHENLSSVHG